MKCTKVIMARAVLECYILRAWDITGLETNGHESKKGNTFETASF